MKHLIPFLIILCLGCKQKSPSIPSNVIPLDKMKMILSEMLIADGLAETKKLGGGDDKKLTEQYYATIYKNFGITREEFAKSYHFYEYNLVLENRLYDSILNEISRREAVVGK